jgi:hypothetical protein
MMPSFSFSGFRFCTAFLAMLFAGSLLLTMPAGAQMFSVSEAAQRNNNPVIESPAYGGIGLMNARFSFYGENGSGSEDFPGGFYEFDDVMYRAGFYTPGLFFEIADGTSVGEREDIRATQLTLGVTSSSNIYVRNKFNIRIPVGLNTSYFLVRTSQTASSNEEFSQSSVYLRSGLHLLYQPFQALLLESVSSPTIGYTIGAFGDTGGLSYILDQELRVSLPNIGGSNYGFTLGYGIGTTRFDNSDERFKYDLSGHRFTIGLSF